MKRNTKARVVEGIGSAYGRVAGALRGLRSPGESRHIDITAGGNTATLHLNPARYSGMDTIASQLLRGTYEPKTRELFTQLLGPGKTLVDVGANVGYFTVLGALLVGSGGRVIAFEPEPTNHGLLADNIRRNDLGQVLVRNQAVAAEPGELFLDVNPAESGWHRLATDNSPASHRKVPVTVTTVDLVLSELGGAVDVVKIDVEGFEPAVVAGMTQTVAANPDISVILEFSPDQSLLSGLDPYAALDTLYAAGLTTAYAVGEKAGALLPVDTRDREAVSRALKGRSINLLLRAEPLPTL